MTIESRLDREYDRNQAEEDPNFVRLLEVRELLWKAMQLMVDYKNGLSDMHGEFYHTEASLIFRWIMASHSKASKLFDEEVIPQ